MEAYWGERCEPTIRNHPIPFGSATQPKTLAASLLVVCCHRAVADTGDPSDYTHDRSPIVAWNRHRFIRYGSHMGHLPFTHHPIRPLHRSKLGSMHHSVDCGLSVFRAGLRSRRNRRRTGAGDTSRGRVPDTCPRHCHLIMALLLSGRRCRRLYTPRAY